MLVTGHTGFKGAWLCLWLENLGAEVCGLSLPPETGSLYDRAQLHGRWAEYFGDIRDGAVASTVVKDFAPDLVIHMAAQPLVSHGWADPVGTFQTNVVGTMNVLDAIRSTPNVKGCVAITTDKVYRPSESPRRHTEADPLGGTDPYAASKAAAEHVAAAWRTLIQENGSSSVTAARAGNVIGGGDFAANRLVPDLIRSFSSGKPARIRHPEYVRPWQHVLDPLLGYLMLGSAMLSDDVTPESLNFGPEGEEPVRYVAERAAYHWGGGASWEEISESSFYESDFLALDSSLARASLGWSPTWSTDEAIARTVAWWRAALDGADPIDLCLKDIKDFDSRTDM